MPQPIPSDRQSSMPLAVVALALGVGSLFGGNQVASKIALQGFTPLLCGALAFTISSLLLWGYALALSLEWRPSSRLVWRLHCKSALLFVIFNATALVGLQFTLASRSSIFIAIHPLFVVVFNSLSPQRERINLGKSIGLGLILMGVLIVYSDRFMLQWDISWLGDSLILLAAAVLGLLILHIRTVTLYVSAIQATLWQMGLSVPVFWLS